MRTHQIRPLEFVPDRNQRRVLRKNSEIELAMGPLCVSEERIELLHRFLSARYPEKNSCGRDYYAGFFLNSMTDTLEFRYFCNGRLIGVGIVDCGATWLNAVYFFSIPISAHLSPGNFQYPDPY